MGLRGIASLALAGVLFILLASPAGAATTVDEVAGELICQCGCTMVVSTCDCGTAEQMRAVIREKLEGGQSKGQILESFIRQYGEAVLAAPTKEGFNLTAWVLPFVALAAGAGVVYLALHAWAARRAEAEAALPASEVEELGEYEERLKKELEAYKVGDRD